MLKHIVFFKVKDSHEGMQKAEILQKIKSLLDSLPPKIEQIKFYETGINIAHSPVAHDICLISAFENEDELEAYKKHPEHVKVVEFINTVKTEGAVVDYQL